MSAARYTNKIRTNSEARVRKVQYRYNDAVSNPLAATCAANPDFSILQYIAYRDCAPPCPPLRVYYYDGGSAFTNTYNTGTSADVVFSSLIDSFIPSNLWYDGGGSVALASGTIYDSGSASNNVTTLILTDILVLPGDIYLDGTNIETIRELIYFDGGPTALTLSLVILDGGNSVPLL
jgi:hypothetical protein